MQLSEGPPAFCRAVLYRFRTNWPALLVEKRNFARSGTAEAKSTRSDEEPAATSCAGRYAFHPSEQSTYSCKCLNGSAQKPYSRGQYVGRWTYTQNRLRRDSSFPGKECLIMVLFSHLTCLQAPTWSLWCATVHQSSYPSTTATYPTRCRKSSFRRGTVQYSLVSISVPPPKRRN